MVNRRRRCCCLNNNYSNCNNMNNNNLETSCNYINNQSIDFNLNCSCGFDDNDEQDVFPSNPMLAQSYVPIQYMEDTFKPCVGLKNGTIFPELVSPYSPCDSMRDIEFIRATNKIGEGCNADGRR